MNILKAILSLTALMMCAGVALAARRAQVSVPVCYMRTAASHAAEQSSQAILGTIVEILGQQGDWYNVRTPDGYTGFIKGNSLHLMSDEECDHWSEAAKVVCLSIYEPLHDDEGYATYGTVLEGEMPDALSGQVTLRLPSGREAYAAADKWADLAAWQVQCAKADAGQVLAVAKSMSGIPYLWGGSSSLAADCSGFTQIAFKAAGMLLPRDTSMQIKCGIEVPALEQALPGDLIFYGNSKGKVNHVAIYLGDGMIIHSSGRVRICRMSPEAPGTAELYTDTPLCIRRVLGVPTDEPGYAAPGVPSLFHAISIQVP